MRNVVIGLQVCTLVFFTSACGNDQPPPIKDIELRDPQSSPLFKLIPYKEQNEVIGHTLKFVVHATHIPEFLSELQSDDIITRINGTPFSNLEVLRREMRYTRPSNLEVLRNGNLVELTIPSGFNMYGR